MCELYKDLTSACERLHINVQFTVCHQRAENEQMSREPKHFSSELVVFIMGAG